MSAEATAHMQGKPNGLIMVDRGETCLPQARENFFKALEPYEVIARRARDPLAELIKLAIHPVGSVKLKPDLNRNWFASFSVDTVTVLLMARSLLDGPECSCPKRSRGRPPY